MKGTKDIILTTASHRGTSVVGTIFRNHKLYKDSSGKNLWIHIGNDMTFKKKGEGENTETILEQIKKLKNLSGGKREDFHLINKDNFTKILKEAISKLDCPIKNLNNLTDKDVKNNLKTHKLFKQLTELKEKYTILKDGEILRLLCCLFACPDAAKYRRVVILDVIQERVK